MTADMEMLETMDGCIAVCLGQKVTYTCVYLAEPSEIGILHLYFN